MTAPAGTAGPGEGGRRGVTGYVRLVAILFAVAIVAALAFAVIYVQWGDTQALGAALCVALAGVGSGLLVWTKKILPPDEVVDHHLPPSSEADRAAAAEAFDLGEGEIGRRRLLLRLAAGAAGALGLAAIFPLASLGPRPGREQYETAWRASREMVDADGNPVRAEALEIGTVLTVFPEGHVGSADAQALVMRVDPADLRVSGGAPDGYVAYSKLCTHAGCAVCCFVATEGKLVCPCHKSTFDVYDGARVLFGPAAKPLPQLPLEIDDGGYIRATGDFTAPVGPQFWHDGGRNPAGTAASDRGPQR